MEKNFKLIKENTIVHDGQTLYQIECIKDIPCHNVKVGDLGGYVENEDNLNDNAWVSGNAVVYNNAKVYDNALVYDNAIVFNNAKVYDNAVVYNYAQVYREAEVYHNAQVFGESEVYDNAQVLNYARVFGNAQVFGDSMVAGIAHVYDNAQVYRDAQVLGNAQVSHNAEVIKGCIYMHIQWPITITHNHIKIGCKFLRIEDWQDYLDKNWKKYKAIRYKSIKAVIDLAKILKEEEGTI
jgi:carbonic anhydrase/acetyltransferase-like protein (isoleucine patch superfamily)